MGQWVGRASEVFFRNLPEFKGRWRLLKIVNSVHLIGLKEPVALARLKLGHVLKLDLRARGQYEAYYTGHYDSDVISTVTGWFKPGWTVMDVGANIGFYSVPFAKRLQELDGTLHCFEPLPDNLKRLRENLELNSLTGCTRLHGFGLSDQKGSALITLRED